MLYFIIGDDMKNEEMNNEIVDEFNEIDKKHKNNDYSVVAILYLCVIVLAILLIRGVMNKKPVNTNQDNVDNSINDKINNDTDKDIDINNPDNNQGIDSLPDEPLNESNNDVQPNPSEDVPSEPNDDEPPKIENSQQNDSGIDSGILDYLG